ncbi:hypothetical protein MRX96_051443 [Rhipicephalus microplus]
MTPKFRGEEESKSAKQSNCFISRRRQALYLEDFRSFERVRSPDGRPSNRVVFVAGCVGKRRPRLKDCHPRRRCRGRIRRRTSSYGVPEVVYSEDRRNSAAVSEKANNTVRQREYHHPRIPKGLRCRPARAQLFLGGLMPGQPSSDLTALAVFKAHLNLIGASFPFLFTVVRLHSENYLPPIA